MWNGMEWLLGVGRANAELADICRMDQVLTLLKASRGVELAENEICEQKISLSHFLFSRSRS
jgi:hypothetical protein